MMNSEKIVWNLMSNFRDQLRPAASLELSLQLLAWAKLTVKAAIPPELFFGGPKKTASAQKVFDTLHALGSLESLRESRLSFMRAGTQIDDVSMLRAVTIVQDVLKADFLNHFEVPEALYTLISEQKPGELFVPKEVADLMVRLGGDVGNKDVYCPFDSLCQFAHRVHAGGGNPHVELSTHLTIFWLISILTDTASIAAAGDPIKRPGFVESGKLKQFDAAILFPPVGRTWEKEAAERDIFNRFPEKTSSSSVLAVRHTLAQTKGKIVLAVPAGLLFSTGVEKSLRDDLLGEGFIETVVKLPSAILPTTAIQLSVLVLNTATKSSVVRFVDASSDQFSSRDGRGRSRLSDLEALLEAIQRGTDESIAVTVPVVEVLAHDSSLEVSRYLRSQERGRIENILSQEKTMPLERIVDFVRPPSKARDEKEGPEVLEVMLSDFPEYGYLTKPQRRAVLDERQAKKNDYWLCPEDIIIAMKGSAGKVAIVPENISPSEQERWVANQSCLVLRAKRSINPKVLFMYLRSGVGQSLLGSMVSGATIPLIQLRALKELPVVVPLKADEDKIVATFNTLVELQSKVETLKAEQQLLSQAFWAI